ncbi:MAG: DUF1294 domain-containing protein [Methylocystaceae bacterium]
MLLYIGFYLVFINGLTFIVFAIDKRRARRAHWRIPERNLLLLCSVGGSIGGWLAMYLLRHKTKHLKFSVGVPLILSLQLLLVLNWRWFLFIF